MYSKLIRSKLEFVANPSQSTIKPLQIDNTIETEVSDEYQYHLQQNKPLFADCRKINTLFISSFGIDDPSAKAVPLICIYERREFFFLFRIC